MSEQYAGISLGVDVSQVDNASQSLKEFAKANDTAAKGIENFVDQEQVARVKAKELAEQLKKQRREFTNIEASIDPTVKKMQQLTAASDQLDDLWRQGIVPDKRFFQLGEMIDTQVTALKKSRAALTEEGRAAAENARQKASMQREQDRFIKSLQDQANASNMTKTQLLELRAAELGVSAQAAPLIASMNKQAQAIKLAGLSAGEYRNAMRMLPAQITDVVTSLASGMPVWLVAIQQGGQIKDSFGGLGNTFKVLLSYLNPLNVGIGLTVGALGALGYAVFKSRKEITEAQKAVSESLGMTGDFADQLALNLRNIAEASKQTAEESAKAFISTKDGADEARAKLIDVGFSYDEARRLVEQYKKSSDFTNLNAQIEAHKLEVLGIKGAWSESAEEVKNYYTAADRGKQSVALGGAIDPIVAVLERAGILQKDVTKARKEGNKAVNETVELIQKEYLAANRVAGAEKSLKDAREAARKIAFSGNKEAIKQAEELIKIRQREVKEAQDAEAKKLKPKKTSQGAIVRDPQEQLDKELYTMKAQLKVLQDHSQVGEKISAQRKALWTTEAQIAILQEAQGKRRLSNEEKALLTSQQKVLSLAKEKAELGDQILAQEKINALNDKSMLFINQMTQSSKTLNETRAMGNREAERQIQLDKIRADYLAAGGGEDDERLQKMIDKQNEYYANEDAKRNDWLAGAKNAFENYGDSATDMYSNVGQIATNALNGLSDMMTEFLTTGKASFADFAKSIISQIIKMITQMVIFNSLSGMFGGGKAFSFAGMAASFSSGGYTGDGGKYDAAGTVHRGEFVMTKEATKRIGVDNLYKMMRGYASGGYVGGSSSGAGGGGSPGGIMFNLGGIALDINNGGDPKGMEQGIRMIFTEMMNESCSQGGRVYEFIQQKTGG